MKKFLSLFLALTMILGLMAGCGGQEDVLINLYPEDADLSNAPNVVLEPDEPPYNLGGWQFEDLVIWFLELPAKDTYTLRFYYAMPGEYLPCTGQVFYTNGEGDDGEAYAEFTATSEEGSWEDYGWVETELKLPEGPIALTMTSSEIPETQDYFLNLRLIQIYTGEEPALPDFMEDGGSSVDPMPVTSDGSGWWVRPDDYDSPGISLADCIYVDLDAGTWTVYNSYGEPGSSFSCSVDGDIFTMSMDFAGDTDYFYDGTSLINTEDGTVEFIKVEDPGFKGQDLNFDGTWYFVGDPDSEKQYVMEGSTFRKLNAGLVENEGVYTKNDVLQGNGNGEFETVMKLGIGDFRDLTPNADHTVLFEQDGFDVEIYVRDTALDPAMTASWDMMNELMNMDLFAHFEDDTQMLLSLEPYGFYVTNYVRDGAGYSPSGEAGPSGHWDIPEPGVLRLMYNDGTQDLVHIPEPDEDLWVESLQGVFELGPIF